MDAEAARRSTTVYLVDRRIDMLPKPLTEDICRCGRNGAYKRPRAHHAAQSCAVCGFVTLPNDCMCRVCAMPSLWNACWCNLGSVFGLDPNFAPADVLMAHLRTTPPLTAHSICSLRADVERLAFSVLWELDQDAQPVSVRFTKSIIRSRAALTYEAAQNRIDGRDTDDVTTGLRLLMKIAKILRQRRCALQQLEVYCGIVSSSARPLVSPCHIAMSGQFNEHSTLVLASCGGACADTMRERSTSRRQRSRSRAKMTPRRTVRST